MRAAAGALLLLLAGCRDQPSTDPGNAAGQGLERAAVATGLVINPASRSIVGAWGLDTDRACIVPGVRDDEGRIGVLIDYGQGQGCAASGTVLRHRDRLDVRFGACQLTARFEGDRIVFPPEVPEECERLCVGRASLAAMIVERQSGSASEAESLRAPSGRALCGD